MRKLIWILILISIVIISSGLIIYFKHFNYCYSKNTSDWGNFATFNGYFLSIVNLIILGYISFVTLQTTQTFNRLQIRPLLFITLDKPEQITGVFKDCWFISNGSKNAALNIIVRYTLNRNSEPYTKWVACTSLGENKRLELFWVHFADKIEICFTDITNERYYLFEFMDYHGRTTEISNEQYLSFLKQATENRKYNMTHTRDILEMFISSEKQKGVDPMKDYGNNFIKKHLI